MTRSNFDLRTWTRIAILAGGAVALGAVIVGPWLWLLVGFAIATSRRGQLLLFGRHVAGRGSQSAPSRSGTATVDDGTQAPHRRSPSHGERPLGGRPSNSG